jgi:hypothetical protein
MAEWCDFPFLPLMPCLLWAQLVFKFLSLINELAHLSSALGSGGSPYNFLVWRALDFYFSAMLLLAHKAHGSKLSALLLSSDCRLRLVVPVE